MHGANANRDAHKLTTPNFFELTAAALIGNAAIS